MNINADWLTILNFGENTCSCSSFRCNMCFNHPFVCYLLYSYSFFCQMCWCSRSDLKVNFAEEKKRNIMSQREEISFFGLKWHFWCILYPSTMLINVKTCKTSVLRHSWGTILLCQLFAIMFWQILWVSRFLLQKDLFRNLNSSILKYTKIFSCCILVYQS